jgi:tetrahydromethanopterin S-methyltransferase subunit B
MTQLVQNPVKSTTINFPINKVKECLNYVENTSPNFSLKEYNEVFNSYKFGNRDGISMVGEGNIIDVNLEETDQNKTIIQIEGSRLIGAINSSAEVMMVKSGMDELLDIISKLIAYDDVENASKEISKSFKKRKSLYNYMGSLIKWTFIIGIGLFALAVVAGLIINAFKG